MTREKSYVVEMISTHSLTRRLTAFDVRATQYVIISTHSLTRRLTVSDGSFLDVIHISTHSLTRRLTRTYPFGLSRTYISTHSLTRRLTGLLRSTLLLMGHFNSQPHKEADRRSLQELQVMIHFNSQPHKEADIPDHAAPIRSECISTHSLTRRLTADGVCYELVDRNFNSQPHKEADVCLHLGRLLPEGYFNSQPHKEADGKELEENCGMIFQLTASQGG